MSALLVSILFLFDSFSKVESAALTSNGKIFWCETPEGFTYQQNQQKKKSIEGIICSKKSVLTSGADSFADFERKICSTRDSNRTALLDLTVVESFYNKHPYWRAGYPEKVSYIPMNWALHNLIRPSQNGLWLEFGVSSGFSANMSSLIKANRNDNSPLYGFDSFEGLPEVWGAGGMGKGQFDRKGVIPPLMPNVKINQGLFDNTLPPFIAANLDHKSTNGAANTVSYVNIDNDLYNGTVFILEKLLPYFEHHTLLHFHELFRYNGKENKHSAHDEMRALYDVLKRHSDLTLQFIPFMGPHRESCLFRVIKSKKQQYV